MRILIILFAIILVAFKKTGASPISQWEKDKGQAILTITPASPWDNICPGETAKAGQADQSICNILRKSIRPTAKKWSPKRWIFRPPMEPN